MSQTLKREDCRRADEDDIRITLFERGAQCRIEDGKVFFKNPGKEWGDGGRVRDYLYHPKIGAFKIARD